MERSPSGIHDPWTQSPQSQEDLDATRRMDREARRMDRESSFQAMEQVFQPVVRFGRSFAAGDQPLPERENRYKFTETDFNIHRKREFPHVHHPLKSMHKKKKKKKDGHKRRKKKRRDVKFQPVLPGVEEHSEPSCSSYESDDSYLTDELEAAVDDAVPSRVPPSTGSPPAPEPGATGDQTGAEPTEDKPDKADTPDKAEKTENGSSPNETKDKDLKRKDSATSTPVRKGKKGSEGQLRMGFLNRLFSDHGMTSPRSSESLRSGQNGEVAAQMFTIQSDDEPQPSRRYSADGEEESPLVSTLNKEPLTDHHEKVHFSLGADDEDEPHKSDDDDEGARDVDDEERRRIDVGPVPVPASARLPMVQITDTATERGDDRGRDKKKVKKKRKHKSKTEHFNLTDLTERRRAGSEIFDHSLRRIPTEPDEAALLALADLDDMKSHRFEDVRGIRRHKIRHHSLQPAQIYKRKASYVPTKKWDHSPHELFVEMDVLGENSRQESEWAERARWIKFEEDVEEGSNRWGKPHVAYLSFHSLLDLRKCIESGAVLLDLEAYGINNIFHCITEQLLISDQIQPDNQGNILRVLLLKHRHQLAEKLLPTNLSAASLKAKFGSSPALTKGRSASSNEILLDDKSDSFTKVDIDNNTSGRQTPSKLSVQIQSPGKHSASSGPSLTATPNLPRRGTTSQLFGVGGGVGPSHQGDILRKIPEGAESAMVLVGPVDFLTKPVCAFVRLSEGQVLDNVVEVPVPVRFIFLLLVPEDQDDEELMDFVEIGRSISTLLCDKMFHDTCYRADNRQDILVAINQFLDDSVVLPPGDWGRKAAVPLPDLGRRKSVLRQRKSQAVIKEEAELLLKKAEEGLVKPEKYDKPQRDPLSRTGRLFGGLIDDVKQRYPHYMSDIKDALNFQCLAAVIFIYFAALSPAITFGGLLSEKTGGGMGISETLLGTSLCGIGYALLSGQPLLIIGATGPLLIFEESLYMICQSAGIDFLALRVWIGIWTAVISVLVVMLDGSAMVRYITQFTEEIFASLISFIFIYEVLKKLYKTFLKHPLLTAPEYYPGNGSQFGNESLLGNESSDAMTTYDDHPQPNTALLTLILCLGTYVIAEQLKAFRNGRFLGRGVRRAIGDFGIPLAILVMTVVDILVQDVYTQKLNVPDGMSPTNAAIRGWFIDPITGVQVWVPFLAIVPAFLVFILVFMESQITSIIVNKKDRNLRKGSGYHLDLLLLGFFCILSGFLGFPFLCGATIRSVSHVSALSVFSRTHAPGEKPHLVEVKEQRVTATLVHVLMGISILMGPLLRQIPMAVLFGVFLYMGVASMGGICLIDRCKLLFMPVKHHPDETYVKRVRTWRMNLYTIVQILCLGVLWAIKMTPGALAFPFVLILLVPVRLFILPRIFSPPEIDALDSAPTLPSSSDTDDSVSDSGQDEPDFYQQSHIT